ncbi:hypothetical protein JW906_04450 [bacterium]|nr:hypothetical protein [bacterium]
MKKDQRRPRFRLLLLPVFLLPLAPAPAQQDMATHTRGKLWETMYNFGYIGDTDVWNYGEMTGVGFYPGFPGYYFPNDEIVANNPTAHVDANFHNFRSGPWIIVKGAKTLVPPDYHAEPREYLLYHSSLATGDAGVLPNLPPYDMKKNFVGSTDFNPLLPEEINSCRFHTATGISVRIRSSAWSYPGYHDFIIFDYVFKNTGEIVNTFANRVDHYDQTPEQVWIVFHSGIQVSTKGVLNFHYDPEFMDSAAPGGGFGGWQATVRGGARFSDYYAIENNETDGRGTLYYSYDFNGGREPVPWDPKMQRPNWATQLTVRQGWLPELQDPACFGFVFLYRTPPPGGNPDPFEADPTHLSIYSDEAQNFNGKQFDSEYFGTNVFSLKELYQFITHDYLPPNNGDLYSWTTSSFGPYTLAPGDSIRLIVAEVAGMMDLHKVLEGDPDHWFPDSSQADIRRNAEAARRALRYGIGARIAGIDLAGDVPEPPPAPHCHAVNVSAGLDTAIVAVRWDRAAEEAQITDGSGGLFYDGASDLSGYRIFRGFDKRGIWDLIADIPASEKEQYWREDLEEFEYLDKGVQFNFEFNYYVQAYVSTPRPWTSANGTRVEGLGELANSDYNMTPLIGARMGPVDIIEKGWDVFVVPNPYVEGDPDRSFGEPNPRKIDFRKLPERATIKIFSVSGDLIKTIGHGPDAYGNLFGSVSWDQRSEAGLLVAPGLYLYVVESDAENSKGMKWSGKLMIIR